MPRNSFASRSFAGLVALVAVAGLGACQGNRSDLPPVHIIQNMDFQSRYDAQEQNDFFEDVDCADAVNHGDRKSVV